MGTILENPITMFNPITIDGLEMSPIQQIQLKVYNRYLHRDEQNKILNFYAELIDSTGNRLVIPVKYYIWLALQFTNTVICDYSTFKNTLSSYNFVEITNCKKVSLNIVDNVECLFTDDNYKIPQHYCKLYTEDSIVKKSLNNASAGMVYGMCTGYIRQNKTYVRGMLTLKALLDNSLITSLTYRKLIVDEVEYICDICGKGVKQDENVS